MEKEKADKLIVKFSSKVYGFAVKKSHKIPTFFQIPALYKQTGF